jgi:iron complex outermembrane receptor protein
MLPEATAQGQNQAPELLRPNRMVTVLDSQEIARIPAMTVSDLLNFVGGVDARQRGALGVQTDLSMRGSTFEQVLVLLNGVRLSDPQTGHHLMNLPVPRAAIARIEVMQGGASYLFGSQAFAGAINIITKKPRENQGQLRLSAGSHQSLKTGYSQHWAGKKQQTLLSGGYTRSDGFKRNTDMQRGQLFGQSHIELNDSSQLQLTAGYRDQGFGAQGFYSSRFPHQYERTKTLLLNASWNKQNKRLRWRRRLYWRRNWDEFQLFREGPGFYQNRRGVLVMQGDTAPAWYGGANHHRSDVLGGDLDVRWTLPDESWVDLSARYRLEYVRSNNLGEVLPQALPVAGSDARYTRGDERHNYSLNFQHFRRLGGGLSLRLALQSNYNSAFGLDFLPGLTAGWKPTAATKLYAAVNRSFRLPSFTDLYYDLGGARGSDQLQPEYSWNYEVGGKWMKGGFLWQASIFRRAGHNIIDWIQRCDSCDLVASNTTQVNMNGLNASLSWRKAAWQEGIKMRHLSLSYQYLRADDFAPPYESLYVLDYLRHQLTARARHRLGKLSISYALSYQQRRGQYREAASGLLQSYRPVWLINAQLSYPLGPVQVSLKAQNLLGRRYYDRGNVELPGRWGWLGASWRL